MALFCWHYWHIELLCGLFRGCSLPNQGERLLQGCLVRLSLEFRPRRSVTARLGQPALESSASDCAMGGQPGGSVNSRERTCGKAIQLREKSVEQRNLSRQSSTP